MRRMLLAALGTTAAALAAAGPAAASGVSITPAGSAQFPYRSYVLALPSGTKLSPRQLHVTEDGGRVASVSLLPATASGSNRFGVVLVIDTSSSMRGKPLTAAFAAAREFASRRNQQQKLGIVLFNRQATTLLAPTTDSAAIDRALAHPPATVGGSRVYDAVGSALDLLAQAKITAGSVVVLSDGADNGSAMTINGVGARARVDGARIYSVGLRDRFFQASSLMRLAAAGHGRYTEASSTAQLGSIFGSLASQLASQYLLSYQSLQGPGRRVQVRIAVAGLGAALSTYATPALPRATRPISPSPWSSLGVVIGVSFGAALLIALAVVALIAAFGRRRRLESRMAGFLILDEQAPSGHGAGAAASSIMDGAERSLERLSWWPTFKENVELARFEKSPAALVVYAAVGSLLSLVLFTVATGSVLLGLLAGICPPFFVRFIVQYQLDKQRKLFAEQLADNLQVIASAMRAGNSFVGALAVAVEDAAEPARRELQRAVTDEQLGVPFDDALRNIARRMENRDLNQVILVAALQRETGGNTAEILERVAATIRERMELRRFVKALTAQGRMTRWVVSALPVALALILSVISQGYLDPLFHTTIGNVLIGVAIALLVSGSLAIKRIVNIKV